MTDESSLGPMAREDGRARERIARLEQDLRAGAPLFLGAPPPGLARRVQDAVHAAAREDAPAHGAGAATTELTGAPGPRRGVGALWGLDARVEHVAPAGRGRAVARVAAGLALAAAAALLVAALLDLPASDGAGANGSPTERLAVLPSTGGTASHVGAPSAPGPAIDATPTGPLARRGDGSGGAQGGDGLGAAGSNGGSTEIAGGLDTGSSAAPANAAPGRVEPVPRDPGIDLGLSGPNLPTGSHDQTRDAADPGAPAVFPGAADGASPPLGGVLSAARAAFASALTAAPPRVGVALEAPLVAEARALWSEGERAAREALELVPAPVRSSLVDRAGG